MEPTLEARTTYRSLTAGGLNTHHTALRLWRKAKQLGTWNPDDLDLSRDAEEWRGLNPPFQDLLMNLAALFMAGEEAVTRDLLPLLKAVADDGYLEDEMYLTAFLWEEAKHIDFFNRFFAEVVGTRADLNHYQGDNYRQLFGVELPQAMNRLYTDASPVAQAEAATVYSMVVEGVVAETGYYGWYQVLQSRDLMPGTVSGIELVQRDEARHIRYSLYLIARLIAEHGPSVWQAVQQKMETLLPMALGIFNDVFNRLEETYGVPQPDRDQFVGYAVSQFEKRRRRLEKACGQPLDEILYAHSETE